MLKTEYPEKRHTFEFRHESWLNEECYDILKAHNHALCIPLAPGLPCQEQMTAAFSYLRFHGGASRRDSSYTDKELQQWAAKIRQWLKQRDVYCYFNNDAHAFAIANAKTLREYLSS